MGEITVMAINNFKPFATAANANVMSQADWEGLPALLSGFTSGKAASAEVNKAIRQASFIAAALAQYTTNKSGLDVLDDGDLNGFITKMTTAFGKDYQALDATLTALAGLATGANKLPYFTGTDTAAQTDLTQVGRDIIGKSSIANVLSYLGLGDGTGRLINVQTFTSSGTYTPTAGTKFVIAEVLGGGGGGGSNAATPSSGAAAGAGGASGAYAICRHTPTGPVSVVVGAAGSGAAPAVNGANGGTGGTSSFGAVSAPGGNGGPAGIAFNVFPTGGNVATGSGNPGGSLIVGTPGTAGSYGILYSDSNATGGGGANSQYGAGGVALTINTGTGTSGGANAKGYGAGGGGAVSVHASNAASSPGGNGSPGIVIIWEYA
ncbi:glycine-rich domain-containing protein [Escherichia coli]